MATLAPLSPPARQPFAVLDGSRVRSLANLKNRQNVLPTSLSSPIKRRYTPPTTIFEDFDSENVDPSVFGSPTKRAKSSSGDVTKKSQFVLRDVTPYRPLSKSSPIRSPPRVRLDTPQSPALKRKLGASTSGSSASSTPAAGRSPKSKRIGILSRRRTSSPFTRIDPPSYSGPSALPFSLDAALNGTISGYSSSNSASTSSIALPEVQTPTLEGPGVKESWFFTIHEDTPEDEAAIIMEHSTCTLDISDDETRRAKEDAKGKENIPPADYPQQLSEQLPSTVEAHQPRRGIKQQTMEMVRQPLGDLKPSDFYAEGLSADSHVVVEPEARKSSLSSEVESAEDDAENILPVLSSKGNDDIACSL